MKTPCISQYNAEAAQSQGGFHEVHFIRFNLCCCLYDCESAGEIYHQQERGEQKMTTIAKVNGKIFRYDPKTCIVQNIAKADED